MQINQQLVRFNQVLTKKINKKVLKNLNVHKLLFSELWLIFSECKPSINLVNITLKSTEDCKDFHKKLRHQPSLTE